MAKVDEPSAFVTRIRTHVVDRGRKQLVHRAGDGYFRAIGQHEACGPGRLLRPCHVHDLIAGGARRVRLHCQRQRVVGYVGGVNVLSDGPDLHGGRPGER